jgi:tRNA threonylcarbamoyladenosine biosynthesis protein TsaB
VIKEVEFFNLLAIDTSTDQAALGVLTQCGQKHVARVPGARRHGRDLVPQIRDLLATAGLKVSELHVVAVGLGPGSYTGLRIGLAAARTLAYVTGAGLLGLDSLEAWARAAPAEARRIYVVADAQRGDVYAAEFRREATGGPLTAVSTSHIEPLPQWAGRLSDASIVMGPGLSSPRIRQAVSREVTICGAEHTDLMTSSAIGLLELAAEQWTAGRRDNLWILEPNYLRRSAAEETWDARDGGKA